MRWILRISSLFSDGANGQEVLSYISSSYPSKFWHDDHKLLSSALVRFINVSFPLKALHGTEGRPFLFYSVLHLFRRSCEKRISHLPFTACQVKEEVCLHEALIPVFTTLPEIRKLFSLLLSIGSTCTALLLSSNKHVWNESDCMLLQYNLNISTALHLDTCLNFSWRKRKHQQKDQLGSKARISRIAVKHTPESPHLHRKPVSHQCQSDQTSSPACLCVRDW